VIQRRILLTTDVVGGVWDFCLTLAEGLLAAGDSVTLLALGSPTDAQRQTSHALGIELINADLKLEWMQDSTEDVGKTSVLVAEVAREIDADLVHANQFAAAFADLDVPVVLTVHSDVLSWYRWTLAAPEVSAEWRPYRDLVRRAVRHADTVVAVSDFLARELHDLYAIDRPIEVIHNGWRLPSNSPRNRTHEPVTLLGGRVWDPAKNLALAAEAAVGWDPGEVYVAGESAHPEGGRVELPPALQPLGFLDRDELSRWLDRASLFISPARYDPFGLLPLQAALHGCALILSDIPSYRELWDGVATFFRCDDADDLRNVWRACLLERPSTEAAFQRARMRFSDDRMLAAYRSTYALLRAMAAA
jgi:glycosyltransferase involved in cell wall biosynthesis